jgi:drug/metabolite transporter (DMT)-like permease
MKTKHNITKATLFALLAAFLYAILAIVIKIVTAHFPSELAVFYRQLFSLLTLLPILCFEYSQGQSLKTTTFPLHLLRAFVSLSAMYCLFYALKYLTLTNALVLSYTRPLFIPLIVWIWFRKKLKGITWVGLFLGFLGVVLILKPAPEQAFHMASIVGLASGLFGGIAFTAVRKLTKSNTPTTIVFYYLALSLPIAFIPALLNWRWPEPVIWVYLVILGILATFYQSFLTLAYKYAHTSKVSAILYSAVVFGAILDWIFFDHLLDVFAVLGVILICIGSILVVKDNKALMPIDRK